MCSGLLLLAITLHGALSQFIASHPSVFVDPMSFGHIYRDSASLNCSYTLIKQGRIHDQSFSMATSDILTLLVERQTKETPYDVARLTRFIRGVDDTSSPLIIALEKTLDQDLLMNVTRLQPALAFYVAILSSPSDMLCLEIAALQRDMFDVVLPFHVSTEMLITKYHQIEFLNKHFGLPFIMPNQDVITAFADKGNFPGLIEDGFIHDVLVAARVCS